MAIAGTELVTDGPALQAGGLVHRVLQAPGAARRPTLVLLHGRHGDEHGMWALRAAMPDDWLMVSPRAPHADAVAGFDWRPPGRVGFPRLTDFDAAVAALGHFVRALPELYGADPAATWLMGFSQGAAASIALAIARPELVRGLAAVVGFVPAIRSTCRDWLPIPGLPVFMAAGSRDPVVPLAVSRASALRLRRLGADLTYREYNAGHRISSQGIRDLRDWWPRQPHERRT